MEYRYKPVGVCSREIILEIEQGILKDIKIMGGCDGNLKGIAALIKGKPIEEIVRKLKGIRCGLRPTSCPDQIANAIEAYTKSQVL